MPSAPPGKTNIPAELIATLGTEPQVVTLALQALVQRGDAPARVLVVHTAPSPLRAPAIAEAVRTLDAAFAEDARLEKWRPAYERIVIVGRHGPVTDTLGEEDFAAALAVLYRTVRDAKAAGHRVHLNLSGGRKLISFCAITAAQLLFDDDDSLWYLQSPPELVQSKALFADKAEDINLIAIPLLRWSPAPPILTDLALADDPVTALTWQNERRTVAKRRFLIETLTPAEREAAELLIVTGAADEELARRLHKSPRTISHQLATVYDKLRLFLGVRDDVRVDRHTLIAEFAGIVPVLSSEIGRPTDSGS